MDRMKTDRNRYRYILRQTDMYRYRLTDMSIGRQIARQTEKKTYEMITCKKKKIKTIKTNQKKEKEWFGACWQLFVERKV